MDLNELHVDPTGVQTWRLGESELLISTTELSQRICELEALRLRMVTDLDTRATAKTLGASNTAAWLSGATRMSPGAASGMVHLGRALTELSATAEALADGRISTAHAKVVTGFFAHLPDGVPADALPPCERYLLDAAAVDNPVELARRAAALRHMLEPVEGSVPDAENVGLNELFATVVGGRGMLKANLDAETMEMLQSALSALSKPQPSEDGTPDKRSPARRRADAFTEVLRRYLNRGDGPVKGAERPHLSLLIRAEDLAAAGGAEPTMPPSRTMPMRAARPARNLRLGPRSHIARQTEMPTRQCSGQTRWRPAGCPGWVPSPQPARAESRVTAS